MNRTKETTSYSVGSHMHIGHNTWTPAWTASEEVRHRNYILYTRFSSCYEGFYVGNWDNGEIVVVGGTVPNVIRQTLAFYKPQNLHWKSITKNEGTHLKLLRIARVNLQLITGVNYLITLEASDFCFYEAKVWNRFGVLSVTLFRPARHYYTWMETSEQMFQKYRELYRSYEGFYVGEHRSDCERSMLGGIHPVRLPSHRARAKAAAKLALEKHNGKEGTDLKLHRIVRANLQRISGIYYITLKASDMCFYEAKVVRRGVRGSKSMVLLFRSACFYHSWSTIKDLKRKGLGE